MTKKMLFINLLFVSGLSGILYLIFNNYNVDGLINALFVAIVINVSIGFSIIAKRQNIFTPISYNFKKQFGKSNSRSYSDEVINGKSQKLENTYFEHLENRRAKNENTPYFHYMLNSAIVFIIMIILIILY